MKAASLHVTVDFRGRVRKISLKRGGAVSDMLRELGLRAVSHIVIRGDIPIPHDEELKNGDALRIVETFSGG